MEESEYGTSWEERPPVDTPGQALGHQVLVTCSLGSDQGLAHSCSISAGKSQNFILGPKSLSNRKPHPVWLKPEEAFVG